MVFNVNLFDRFCTERKMQMLNEVKVIICGKEYKIKTASSPNYVYALARALEARINDITNSGGGFSPYTASIMVALSLLDDVNQANQRLDNIRNQSKEYVDEEAAERGLGNGILSDLGKGIVNKTIEVALNSKLEVDNYLIFNTTHVQLGEETKTLSLGILGHVFTFDKQMLRDALEASAKEKAEKKSERKAAKEASKEARKLEKQLKKEERKREKEARKEEKRKKKEEREKQKNMKKGVKKLKKMFDN